MKMMKQYLLIGCMAWLAATATAQIRREIDKAKKDPQTVERAARADAALVDLRKVTDCQQQENQDKPRPGQKMPEEKKGRKKKS